MVMGLTDGEESSIAGLCGFYPFDEGDPLADQSGAGNHLTSAGADPVYDPSGGLEGGAYIYDGAQRLISPIDINPGSIPELTMGAWVKVSDLEPGLKKAIGSDNGGWDRTIGLDNREGDFRLTSFIGNGRPVVGTPAPENTDDYAFLAAVYDQPNNEVTVYVDGNVASIEPLAAVTEPTGFGGGFPTTSIGSLRPDNAAEGWVGHIDNAFFIKGLLSEEEITGIRDGGAAVIPGTDPTNPDTDGDGLLDSEEQIGGCPNPLLPDTDGDGFNDKVEKDEFSDPCDADSVPEAGGLGTGLVSYWPLDGNLDDVEGDHPGEAMGGADLVYADGKFGQGVDLDGVDQFIQISGDENVFDFQGGTGFSISIWFRVDAFTKSWQALVAKGEGNRWRVHRRGEENILTGNGGNADVPAGPTNVNDGEIHHLVLVSDPIGGTVKLWIDGQVEAENVNPNVEDGANPMMIGENPDARGRTWDGLVDDVAAWQRPLTDVEIASLWNGGEGKTVAQAVAESAGSSLVAFWNFDEGTDDVVGGIPGTLEGGAELTDGTLNLGGAGGQHLNVTDEAGMRTINKAFNKDVVTVSFDQKWNEAVANQSSFWFHSPTTGAGQRAFQAHGPWGNGTIFFDTAGCCDGGTQRINGPPPEGTNYEEWNNFVFVKNGDAKQVYVNGVLAFEGNNTNDLPIDVNRLVIGGGENGGNSHRGQIDNFAIFNRALTGEDATKLANGVSPQDLDGPSGIFLDFAGDGPNSSGAAPAPWVAVNNLVQDEAFDVGGGVTLTARDDGFNPNNPAGSGAFDCNGFSIPAEAADDYLFKIADTAGTEARIEIGGLAAGTYDVTVFEGRTTDTSRLARSGSERSLLIRTLVTSVAEATSVAP